MRTENQIQSKINEMTLQRRSLESRLAPCLPATLSGQHLTPS